jgi:hypothetical protein
MTQSRLGGIFQRGYRVMLTLLVLIGAWLMLNAYVVFAAINDEPQVNYVFGASVVIGLVISGTILMLP